MFSIFNFVSVLDFAEDFFHIVIAEFYQASDD